MADTGGVGGVDLADHAADQEIAEAVSVVSSDDVTVAGESVYVDLKLLSSSALISSLMSLKLSIKWLDTSRLFKLICKFL